jgi:hypothetical protein
MLTIIFSAGAAIVVTLALSWVASFVGFRKLVSTGAPDRAVAWTAQVGRSTGAVVALEMAVALVALVVYALA